MEKKILGKKIKITKMWAGEEYQVVGNFIHPCTDRDLQLNNQQKFDVRGFLPHRMHM